MAQVHYTHLPIGPVEIRACANALHELFVWARLSLVEHLAIDLEYAAITLLHVLVKRLCRATTTRPQALSTFRENGHVLDHTYKSGGATYDSGQDTTGTAPLTRSRHTSGMGRSPAQVSMRLHGPL